MKILAIVGVSNSGKTSSIKYLMRKMIESEASIIRYYSPFWNKSSAINSRKSEVICHIDESIKRGLDSDRNIGLLILNIYGVTIGATTYGDSIGDIYHAFDKAMEITHKKLDYFVCGRHKINNIHSEFQRKISDFEIMDPVFKIKLDPKDSDIWDEENCKVGQDLFDIIKDDCIII